VLKKHVESHHGKAEKKPAKRPKQEAEDQDSYRSDNLKINTRRNKRGFKLRDCLKIKKNRQTTQRKAFNNLVPVREETSLKIFFFCKRAKIQTKLVSFLEQNCMLNLF
jgi:hypothetical protein